MNLKLQVNPSRFFFLAIFTFFLFATTTSRADCTVSSNVNATSLTGCSGIMTITATVTVNSNVSFNAGLTKIIINSGGNIRFTANSTLTLPAGCVIEINGTGDISASSCNNFRRIRIGATTIASCNGWGFPYTFAQLVANGGYYGAPSFTASSNNPTCTNSVLNLTATRNNVNGGPSGVAAFTYSWTGPGGWTSSVQNPTRNPAVAGTYTVTVTDVGGETTTSNVVIAALNTPPAAPSATGDDSRCGPGTLTVLAIPAMNTTVDWYASASGGTVLPGGSGTLSYTTPIIFSTTTYYAESRSTITGCVSSSRRSAVATIINNPTAPTSPVGATRCNAGSLSISATAPGGATIDWYANSSGGTVLPGGSGTLTYTTPVIGSTTTYYAQSRTTVGGCISPTRTPVTATISSIPAAPVITADYCVLGNGSVRLTSSYSSGNTWTTGETTQIIDVNLAGSYSVTYNSGDPGCSSISSVTVGNELTVNGNFELWNGNFNSAYTYHDSSVVGPSALWAEGLYTVAANAHNYHSNFWGKSRTNPGTGKFLMVNGSGSTPVVWEQNVNVVAGTTYYFSAYGLSLNTVVPYAQLQFNIDGTQLGSVGVLGAGTPAENGPFNWVRFFGEYTAPSTGTITLSIRDIESALGGNDFGLDDISFSTLSPSVVNVDPTVNNGAGVCIGDVINLKSNRTGGMSPFTFSWTGPSGYTSALSNPVIASAAASNAGVYTVSVTDAHGCTSAGSYTVVINPTSAVTSTISNSGPICLGTTINLTSTPAAGTTATLIHETFDGLTNLWTTTNTSTGGTPAAAAWTLRSSSYSNGAATFVSDDATQFYLSDSYSQAGTTTNTILQSPVLNSNGYTTLTLSLKHYFRYAGVSGESARVQVSTNGSTWTTVATYTSNQGAPNSFATASINLNAYINQATLYLRFRYDANAAARYWAINTVSITGGTTATNSWTSNPPGFSSALANPSGVLPTESTCYTATVTSSIGCSASATPVCVVVTDPTVTSTTPATTCGPASVTLGASVAGGGTVDWYATPTGGTPLPGGTATLTYTTPFISNTTTYYAQGRTTSPIVCNAASRVPVVATVNPVPAPTASISAPSICAGQTIDLSSSSGVSYPATILNETFNAGLGSWTAINTSTGGTPANAAWTNRANNYTTPDGTTISPGSAFMLSDSRAQGAGTTTTQTTLISPSFSTIGYSDVSLSLDHYFRFQGVTGESINIEVSKDGSTWVTEQTYTSNQGVSNNFTTPTISLNAYINESSVQVRFRYNTGGRARYWAINSVTITGTAITHSYSWTSTPPGYSSASQNPTGISPALGSTSYTVTVTNSLGCSANATPVSVTVNAVVTPSISININSGSNPACSGTSVTFEATPTNGGGSPAFQWIKNGGNILGANSSTYTATAGVDFVSGDLIRCVLTSNATCASPVVATSSAITMTVNPSVTPTISISISQNSICTGFEFTANITNGGGSPLYQWKKNGNNVGSNSNTYTSSALVNGDIITAELTSSATCPTVNPATSNAITVSLTPQVTTWTGAGSNDWNLPTNWSNAVPNKNKKAIIPTGTLNSPLITASAEVYDLQIDAGAVLDILSNNTLDVYGSFENNGTFNAASSLVSFKSCSGLNTNVHNITSSNSTTTTFYDITLDDAQGATLTSDVNLIGALTLTNGTFTNSSNTFTIKSNSTSTGRIAPVQPTANYSGNIKMERFAPGGVTGWALIGNSIQSATLADWIDNFPMTGFTGAYQGPSMNGFVSVYTYDETPPGVIDAPGAYVPATNVTNPISLGKGFWVYLGAYGVGGSNTLTTPDITFEVEGQPHIGNFNFNPSFTNSANSADGFNLIANPYPSTIDWYATAWTKTNMNDAIYVFQADNGQYATFINGISVNGGSRYIASSQAFYVQANAANPVLTATEDIKSNTNPVFFKEKEKANILRLKVSGFDMNDETVIHLNSNATELFDGSYDAVKFYSPSPELPSIASIADGKNLTVNSLPFQGKTIHIPVRVTVGKPGYYSLSWTGGANFPQGTCIVIEDLDNGNKTNISTSLTYEFKAKVGFRSPRFMIHISTPLPKSVVSTSCSNNHDGSITVQNGSGSTCKVQLWKGQDLIQQAEFDGTVYTFDNLSIGSYTLTYPEITDCGVISDPITIQAETKVNASFVPSASKAAINEPISFKSEMIKGAQVEWDFGDGNTATNDAVVSHQYAQEGVYEVTLKQTKGTCSEQQTLTVNITNTTISSELMDVQVQNGVYYAVFNFNENTQVVIHIINALGQQIGNSQEFEGKNGKIKLNLDQAAEGVYLISLQSKDRKTTKRIVK